MKEILLFLVEDGSFLYEEYGFRITKGEYKPYNGGGGIVDVADKRMCLSFVYDRGVMNLTLKSTLTKCDSYSIWYVMELLTGDSKFWRYDLSKFPMEIPSINQRQFVTKFQTQFGEIYDLFSIQNVGQTIKELDKLVREISNQREVSF